MGGCLACLYKSKVVVSEAPKELLHCTERRDHTVSEDFWTNFSTLDMENYPRIRSQGKVSSISTSNVTVVDSQGGGSDPSEFVNHGLTLWNQTRKWWVGSKTKTPKMHERRVQEPVLSKNVTYESLLGSNKPFPRPLPLSEMVQFLVETWEQEGLHG
ncbi:PREDICTED: uncharacterized protein LOC104810505 [Tarenaya hassleriana]|uniref:uncharacterized protein LOC104810505 n=1 Tax=Tarenaya hassleriana TaxID=28532 RepID=UPI00053C978F|nr:PREDICTED: uncharacterized protein LOC104810505 [Tarenaya hassleriana]